jgi:hypothetical protein
VTTPPILVFVVEDDERIRDLVEEALIDVASKVTSPYRASVDVSTNSVTTCKPIHAAAATFRPTPAAIAF